MAESPDQCPTCGHVKDEVAPRAFGDPKGKQRKDREDRMAAYREWRHDLGDGMFCADVDQVEWRVKAGQLVPVATIELSRLDGEMLYPEKYLEATLRKRWPRTGERSFQRQHSEYVARRLGVPCFFVIVKWDLTTFWIYNLTNDEGWWTVDQEDYIKWLRSL